ncbi:Uncharacterised protein [Mycobacterium tuberculosis]|nr:Uncharacterised protein [Mycobacterium tuberculosis]
MWIGHFFEHCARLVGDRGQPAHPDVNANP